MDLIDEKVLMLRRKAKEEQNSIYNDFFIQGEKIQFKETHLFNNKMSIYLPEDFIDMPKKIAKLKYPSEQRPQVIKTNLLGSINFAFNLFEKDIKTSQIEMACKSMKEIMKKVNPANIFYSESCEELIDTKLCWFDFKGYAMDVQIYYIVYITAIGGKLQHGMFNCAMTDRENWKDAAFQVIRSIKDLTEEV